MPSKIPLANGLHAIWFKSAAFFDTPVDERVFDGLAEDQIVIKDLHVRLARDLKVLPSLERAA